MKYSYERQDQVESPIAITNEDEILKTLGIEESKSANSRRPKSETRSRENTTKTAKSLDRKPINKFTSTMLVPQKPDLILKTKKVAKRAGSHDEIVSPTFPKTRTKFEVQNSNYDNLMP